MNKDVPNGNEILEDTQEIQQDTDTIIDNTKVLDKKINIVIYLWLLDKVIMFALILLGFWIGSSII